VEGIVMAERGNTKHGQDLDDQMKHETQGVVHGNQAAHVEEGRETEPFVDDTDSPEIQEALNPVAAPDPVGDGEGEQ
jgi:hypothetical protein